MDALAQLDEVLSDPAGCASEGDSLNAATHVSSSSGSPNCGTLVANDQTDATNSASLQPTALVPAGATSTRLADDGSEAVPIDPNNCCPGCGRTPMSRNFFDNDIVTWALPNHRGKWCKDCHGCWRLGYSSHVSLVMLAAQLRDPQAWQEWALSLICYACLRREGLKHMTEVLLNMRIDFLKVCLRMLGIPAGPFCIRFLANAVQQDVLQGGRLVTVFAESESSSAAQPRIGYIADFDVTTSRTSSAASSARLVQRPYDASFIWATNKRRNALMTAAMEDAMMLPKHCDAHAIATCHVHQKPVTNNAENRFMAKVDKMTLSIKALLRPFSTDEWKSTKEALFTQPIANINGMMRDVRLNQSDNELLGMLTKVLHYSNLGKKASLELTVITS